MPIENPEDNLKYPTVTEITSNVTDKSGALTQWAANMVVEWIRQHAKFMHGIYKDPAGRETVFHYNVTDEQLNQARFNFRKVSQEALDVGSQVHEAIMQYFKTGKEPVNPPEQVANAFLAFLEFKDEHKLETMLVEERLFADDWCGQLDWYGLLDDKTYVLDWKSSKGHYRDMRIQAAAYRKLLIEGGYPCEGHGVVRLDKETGIPDFKDHTEHYQKDANEFFLSKMLWMARHERIAGQFVDTVPF